MYDINVRNVKKGNSFYYVFLIIGIVTLIVLLGIIIFSFTRMNSFNLKTTSINTEVTSYRNNEGQMMYKAIYDYDVNGIIYKCGSDVSYGFNPGNKDKTIYYEKANPASCITSDSKSFSYITFIFFIIPIVFITIGIVNISRINKRVKLIKELNKTGRLVKNLPYYMENTNISVNGTPIKRIVVDYVLPSGSFITLSGDPRYDRKTCDEDGMVDLVIDEKNPDNYYIDFEINRITGNLPNDYFSKKQAMPTEQ